MKRAIFPLPVFILPSGYTRLRIFEPRYLAMVKESLKKNQGFVLCTYRHDREFNVSNHGCLMNIIDFDQDKSGQLLIDIYAETAVSINNVYQDQQQLRHADITRCAPPTWYSNTEIADKHQSLSRVLTALFANNSQLADLYRDAHFDNLAWVVARWLEVLPISIDKKQQLAHESNFENLLSFLHTLINNEFAN
ncbi:LON peptidase substrate-binding domain-containing protein [Pseudoalteromonas mariniglutinosa]|uniref:LON peptidase substrate-binding domain-containing protein n=1 Tax=Pseudoalteromonas mariniglutinosa TaxID=206042 RepID=UPI003851381D